MKEGTHSNTIYFLRRNRIPKATAENTRMVIKGDIVENIEQDSVNVSKLSKLASFDRSPAPISEGSIDFS
jgi:hypothetical protein